MNNFDTHKKPLEHPDNNILSDIRQAEKYEQSTPEYFIDEQLSNNKPPVTSLPEFAALIVEAVWEITQAPMSLAFNSVLAAVILTVQNKIEVLIPGHATARPVSCFFLSIAESGSRKTSCDDYALRPIRDYERKSSRKKSILINDPTVDGITEYMKRHKSLGIFTSEGGQFIGGYDMKKDNELRAASVLSELWGGGSYKYARVGRGSGSISGKITVHLLVQPDIADNFINNQSMQRQGLFSRILPVAPSSNIGKRLIDGQDYRNAHKLTIERYNKLMFDIVKAKVSVILTMQFSEAAEKVYYDYHNKIETAMGEGGELEDIRNIVNKLPEIVCRIAAVIEYMDNISRKSDDTTFSCMVSENSIHNAIRITEFYKREWINIINKDTHEIVPHMLYKFLCNKWNESFISISDIRQRGPLRFRKMSQGELMSHVNILRDKNLLIQSDKPQKIKGNTRNTVYKIIKNE